MTNSHERPGGTMMVANILAIVGSIILIVIIIWGLIHLLSLSGGFFSSLFGGDSSKIEISAPSEVTSGQPATISWKHSADEQGMYAVMYPCSEGLRFSTPGPEQAFVTMPCGAAFGIGSATTSTVVLPMLTGTSSIKTPFSVLFIPSSTSSSPVEGTVTMTVKTAGVPIAVPATTTPTKPAPTTPKPTTPSYPTTPVSQGPADLAVTITSVSIDQWGNGTVTFNVSNIGGSSSGGYYFTAQIPTAQPYTYVSPAQSPLGAGSYIVNTLRFTQAIPGNVYIVVDPANTAPESNEGNNSQMQYISGSYPYDYYNYQYPRY